jgi:hypothetical protein
MIKKQTSYYIPIFSIVILSNILFSTYFIPIFLSGIIFLMFLHSLKKEYYYLLFFSIVTFLIIENTHGLKPFSFTFISVFIYFFIIPKVKHLFSSSSFSEFFYIVIFYTSFFIVYIFSNGYDTSSYDVFIINFIIDSLLIGFIL